MLFYPMFTILFVSVLVAFVSDPVIGSSYVKRVSLDSNENSVNLFRRQYRGQPSNQGKKLQGNQNRQSDNAAFRQAMGIARAIIGRKGPKPKSSAAPTPAVTLAATSTTQVAPAATSTVTPAATQSIASVKPSPTTGTQPLITNGPGFCAAVGLGGVLADGSQKDTSTCSETVQGALPDFNKCVSSLILEPANAAELPNGVDIEFAVMTTNLDHGFFENPNERYFSSPQTLNAQGIIEGHQHVTVQELGNAQAPPVVTTVAFFRGLDGEDVNQVLRTTIPGSATLGKPGLYRICTMSGSRGHQPTLCGRARRGSQDDCIRVTIT